MTQEQMKLHCLQFAAVYAFLQQDLAQKKHDPDQHNLCSAVVETSAGTLDTFFSYSNPSALPDKGFDGYDFIIGSEGNMKIINRGGMQDLHTEVRLLNFLHNRGLLQGSNVINFFSSRSVCPTCRTAIYDVMRRTLGQVAVMAYEFKVEKSGTLTEFVYPILPDVTAQQAELRWQ